MIQSEEEINILYISIDDFLFKVVSLQAYYSLLYWSLV